MSKKVKLKPISRKGTNRISQFGETWNVKRDEEFRVLLTSEKGNDLRWVWKQNDPNFEIKKV